MRAPILAALTATIFVASPAAAQKEGKPWYEVELAKPTALDRSDDYSDPRGGDDPASHPQPYPTPWAKYDWDRPDPRKGGYYADAYHSVSRVWDQRLRAGDRVYRGRDRHYYCRMETGETHRLNKRGRRLLGEALPIGGSAILADIPGDALAAALARDEILCDGMY